MDLDDAYDNQGYVSNSQDYPPRWLDAAETYRRRMGACNRARLGLMYGHGTRHAMDLFTPIGRREGLVVFVHGGYWRRFGREHFSHLADGLVPHHWAVAMPSYDLCPRVRIAEIVRQVADAVSAAAREVPDLPIRLVGHSAGGHLVARLAEPGLLPGPVAERVARVMAISPVSDLRPLLRTSINDDLHLDEAEAAAESPILRPAPDVPASVWVGEDELPAFRDQARWLSEAWNCDLVVEAGRNHFDVVEGLADAEGRMVSTLLS